MRWFLWKDRKVNLKNWYETSNLKQRWTISRTFVSLGCIFSSIFVQEIMQPMKKKPHRFRILSKLTWSSYLFSFSNCPTFISNSCSITDFIGKSRWESRTICKKNIKFFPESIRNKMLKSQIVTSFTENYVINWLWESESVEKKMSWTECQIKFIVSNLSKFIRVIF